MSLASRGLRDLDGGPETVSDGAELGRIRRQARRVHLKSLGAALVVAAVVVGLGVLRG
ncbi:MAG: hypothetical protein IT373_20275 [Polyangiaceae bacterium]|nr:hypothetical protein [Polyangiaceae bacterium]